MGNRSKYAEYVPVVIVVAGFLLIGLGWNGAAGLDYTQGQIPYVISGGLAGVGLIVFGSASMVARSTRRDSLRQAEQLKLLSEAVINPQHRSTSNGVGSKTPSQAGLVITGASAFHLPTCRLVGGVSDFGEMSRDEAEAAGLKACRVCNP